MWLHPVGINEISLVTVNLDRRGTLMLIPVWGEELRYGHNEQTSFFKRKYYLVRHHARGGVSGDDILPQVSGLYSSYFPFFS